MIQVRQENLELSACHSIVHHLLRDLATATIHLCSPSDNIQSSFTPKRSHRSPPFKQSVMSKSAKPIASCFLCLHSLFLSSRVSLCSKVPASFSSVASFVGPSTALIESLFLISFRQSPTRVGHQPTQINVFIMAPFVGNPVKSFEPTVQIQAFTNYMSQAITDSFFFFQPFGIFLW